MLRPAAPEDAAAVAELERLLFGAGAWSLDAVAGELLADGRRGVLDERAGAVAGYAITMLADDTADLQRIGVHPDHQRRGVAQTLLRTVIDQAGRDGVDRMLLEVSADNEAALGLYRREGFAEIHRRRRYYPDGSDAVVMSRSLKAAALAATENEEHGSV